MKRVYFIYMLFLSVLLFACSDKSPNNNPPKTPSKSVQKSLKATPSEPVPPEQLTKARELLAVKYEDLDGKAIFKRNCASCHGFKGNLKSSGAKDLTISKISMEESVAQIYFGKGLMLPYSKLLSDAEIVAVAKYAKGLRK